MRVAFALALVAATATAQPSDAASVDDGVSVDARGLQAITCPGTCPVFIQGLVSPASVSWNAAGVVFIAEKAGRVKTIQGWKGTATNVILDISAQVSNFGCGTQRLI